MRLDLITHLNWWYLKKLLTWRVNSPSHGWGRPPLHVPCGSRRHRWFCARFHYGRHWTGPGPKGCASCNLHGSRPWRTYGSTWTQTIPTSWRIALWSQITWQLSGAGYWTFPSGLSRVTVARGCSLPLRVLTGHTLFPHRWSSRIGIGRSATIYKDAAQFLHAFAFTWQPTAGLCVNSSGWGVTCQGTPSLPLL